MERLYRPQAEAYDRTREGFLHGRRELIGLLEPPARARLVELGGGTGRNLEFFGDRIPSFERVTLVDLCAPLLDRARERCRQHAWDTVTIVEGDATTWRPADGQAVDIVYFSYSLTMIPDWFRAVDNAVAMLKPGGTLGVVDFYGARKHAAPGHLRQRALTRAFWRWWFGRNDVRLNPDHLPYLESRTTRIHHAERHGRLPYVPFLRAPYFLYLGRKEG
jgi:S-adenosylmethionine-diacylgycerolhomoserine-N-methlytransferase